MLQGGGKKREKEFSPFRKQFSTPGFYVFMWINFLLSVLSPELDSITSSGLPKGIADPRETESEHWESNLCFANLTGDAKESHVWQKWLNLYQTVPSKVPGTYMIFSQQLHFHLVPSVGWIQQILGITPALMFLPAAHYIICLIICCVQQYLSASIIPSIKWG